MTRTFEFNPFIGNFCKLDVANIGGLYGVNTETLTGNITLTPGVNKIYQYLNPASSNRIVTLATAGAIEGDFFVIRNNADYNSEYYLAVKQSTTVLDQVYAGKIVKYIFNGTNWVPASAPSGEADNKRYNQAFGWGSIGHSYGMAIGSGSMGYSYGVGIGVGSTGYFFGVAIGYASYGYTRGVALGSNAYAPNNAIAIGYFSHSGDNQYGVALGYYSRNVRYGELTINIDGNSSQKNNIIVVGLTKTTTNNTPVVMLCAGQSAKYCTVRASSALTFKIMVTARDNTTGDCAAYLFDGLIKRDASNNTTLCVCNKTVEWEDDATWDCDVTADDTNEAITITVTGDASNTVQWTARLDGVETHF